MTGYDSLLRGSIAALLAAAVLAAPVHAGAADGSKPAKQLFGAAALPAMLAPQPVGFYAKGCLAGGVALPADGPTWQVMRPSRNRNWGHPDLVALVERLSRDAAASDGWPGLLVGDMAQPRGGPMITGHASHQVGLDADIWLTPMPARTLSRQEREEVSATSMLKKDSLYVDPKIWTQARANLLMRAASYPEVQRIFIHPGIKKMLCDTWKGDRSDMGKLRPYWGHHYHFHIRIKCPPGATGCTPQADIGRGDGCDKSLAWWFTDEPWKPAKPDAKPKPKPREVMLSDLPAACSAVLDARSPASAAAATVRAGGVAAPAAPGAAAAISAMALAPSAIPVPTPRPANP
ncbi:murein endopeptidase [Hoeflea marina]|uniref:Murein endopeptidase n=1 Tax=Hoeflea marina TaxID=274592 RepID=A0A317PIN7_9HYPH|nr:penicillin-insensitive murein endopeptidase [Hoeflea marina]PWW00194.1 murein endopeptidase [Hoeflea marina]